MTNYYTHEASCSGSSFLAAGVSPEASHDSMGCHGAGLVTGQREKDGFPKQGRGLLPLKRVRPDAGRTPCEDTETHRHRGKTHMKQRQNCAPTPQGSPGAPEAGRGEEAPPPRGSGGSGAPPAPWSGRPALWRPEETRTQTPPGAGRNQLFSFLRRLSLPRWKLLAIHPQMKSQGDPIASLSLEILKAKSV